MLLHAPQNAKAQELEANVPRFPNPANATVGRRLFVRGKVTSTPASAAELHVHDLEDLLE